VVQSARWQRNAAHQSGRHGAFIPPILPLNLELAERDLAALSEAVVPVAFDEAGNPGIVIGGGAIVGEIVEQREQPAADARTAQLDDRPIRPDGRADLGLGGHRFAVDPPLDAVARAVGADIIAMPIAYRAGTASA
jgi:hypothetical protein